MEYRTLGKTGLNVSVLGFGGAPIGFLTAEQRQVERILKRLLDQGVNVVDTAAAYLGSEEAIGRALAGRRDDVVLISKCGDPGSGAFSKSWRPENIAASVDRSLKLLRTDRLDVMLLHSCHQATLSNGAALEALVKARDAGKIRHVGYSGDDEVAAYAAHLDEIAVLELSLNICDQSNLGIALPPAQNRGLGVIAKRPIANAAWKDRSQQEGIYQDYSATYSGRLERMQVSPGELGIDGEAPQAWAELALRFTLSLPGVHTAIVGTTNPDHVAENVRAVQRGPLPQRAVEVLRNAFREAERDSGVNWRGQM